VADSKAVAARILIPLKDLISSPSTYPMSLTHTDEKG